ncbi:replication factor C small subunit [Piscirickettsia salmonis]|uniref:AAA family ATPase n=1 Tax=Piscirickettsia salmonis TaxID=1238 RepID=UPI0012BA0DAC|nr:MoxR family ATPase [Piscirickettsia salmonis]QGP50793.1 replication factor C small subunit [Piscirickettsia salmonis]
MPLDHQITDNQSLQDQFIHLQDELNHHIIGQKELLLMLQIALLADGHLLVEGAPGLAKTTAIKALSHYIEGDFQRIQFTPDLLPSDITGTDVFRPQTGEFYFQHGPLFHPIILADEINRAPAKVQSALLEAMGERQITVGSTTYPLPQLFLVMATQNPLEQEGTFPLPEAQLDRFLLHVEIGYPNRQEEAEILKLVRQNQDTLQPKNQINHYLSQEVIFAARQECQQIFLSPAIEEYIVQLIIATRLPEQYNKELAHWLRIGASPRATIALERCARAHAWLANRNYIAPDDVHQVLFNILRHRLLLSFEAQAQGITTNQCIQRILETVPTP